MPDLPLVHLSHPLRPRPLTVTPSAGPSARLRRRPGGYPGGY